MTRIINLGAAQMGPIARDEGRAQVVERLIAQLREAKRRGCELVVFPELTLTTFFPRWWLEDEAELEAFYETEMPGPETRPLFEEARRARSSASAARSTCAIRPREGSPPRCRRTSW